MKAIRLRTEYMENPMGIDIREPYLSWNCSGGKKQTAYEIRAVSGNRVIWNSGKVATRRMNSYLGVKAGSRQRVYWQVRLWDEEDRAGDWSEEAFFEMGLLEREQFVAKWINPELAQLAVQGIVPEQQKNADKEIDSNLDSASGVGLESGSEAVRGVGLEAGSEAVGGVGSEAVWGVGRKAEQGAAPGVDSERNPQPHKPASYLRTSFRLEKDFSQGDTSQRKKGEARLYITCHGLYEAFLNGHRVGDFVLAPGTSTYDKQLAYQTYDVTELLQEGKNEVQVILGDGWYRSCSGVDGDRNLYGEDVALYFQLEVDGRAVCVSDESWEASQNGPIREDDMQQGEVVDARLEEIGEYHGVRVEEFGTENLVCSNCVPVVEAERFAGKLLRTPNGETVIDYGQNLAGYIEFTVHAHAGDRIILTHGETLDEDGNFTAENFQDRKRHKEGGTRQQVVYICKEGENHYKSKFTIWGFRYAKVETDVDLSDAVFTSIAVYSRMEQLGRFECSDSDVNKLVENSIWSQKSNFCDVPTDCPTRERAAWAGDMGVFAGTGIYLEDCYPVIRKWLGECRLNQYEDGKVANIAPRNNNPSFFTKMLAGSVGWGDACIIVPYVLYKRYGDVRILEENYDMMCRWFAYLESRAGKGGQQETKAQAAAASRMQIPPDLTQIPESVPQMLQGRSPVPRIPEEYGAMTAGMPMGLEQIPEEYEATTAGMPVNLEQTPEKHGAMATGMPVNLEQIPEEYRSVVANLPKEKLAEMMKKFSQAADMAGGTDDAGAKAHSTGTAKENHNPYAAYAIETGVDYGEWCEPDVESTSAMGRPQGKVATAYFARSGQMLAEIAGILGKEEDAARYSEIAEKSKMAFRHMATDNGRIHSDRQAEYVRAISFNLLDEEEKLQAAADLNQLVIENGYHLNTGFLSTPSLCGVLAENGYVDTAFRLLLQDTMPSWLYAVKKGATTIWETWDGTASLNHYSYGAVCGWLFSGVCGIRLEQGHIIIQPTPHKSLAYSKASYLSPLGEIVSGWRYEGEKLVYEIEIPSNAEADVILPEGKREHLGAGKYRLKP